MDADEDAITGRCFRADPRQPRGIKLPPRSHRCYAPCTPLPLFEKKAKEDTSWRRQAFVFRFFDTPWTAVGLPGVYTCGILRLTYVVFCVVVRYVV